MKFKKKSFVDKKKSSALLKEHIQKKKARYDEAIAAGWIPPTKTELRYNKKYWRECQMRSYG